MLTEFQKSVLLFIADQALTAKNRFHKEENVRGRINVAGAYAFALYCDLLEGGNPISFSETMLRNRGVPPTDPEFFRNLHALEDFVANVNPLSSTH